MIGNKISKKYRRDLIIRYSGGPKYLLSNTGFVQSIIMFVFQMALTFCHATPKYILELKSAIL